MTKYEVLYIISTDVDESVIPETIEKFKSLVESNGGEVEKVDDWGKKKLAYPINYKEDGNYVLMTFSSSEEFPKELERNFKISDVILRYLVTKVE